MKKKFVFQWMMLFSMECGKKRFKVRVKDFQQKNHLYCLVQAGSGIWRWKYWEAEK